MEEELRDFYQNNLKEFGPSAQGVGWKNAEAQRIRFEQLAKVFNRSAFTLNDLGCGVGDFMDYAAERMSACTYRGYDLMEDMLAAARSKHGHRKNSSFHLISDAGEMESADYTIASGIFNLRFKKSDEAWLGFVLETLSVMNIRSTRGIAFNMLTKYSDKEFMKPELYYADPCVLFDFCKRNFSRNVALLHDYNQYDFTIIVRKDL